MAAAPHRQLTESSLRPPRNFPVPLVTQSTSLPTPSLQDSSGPKTHRRQFGSRVFRGIPQRPLFSRLSHHDVKLEVENLFIIMASSDSYKETNRDQSIPELPGNPELLQAQEVVLSAIQETPVSEDESLRCHSLQCKCSLCAKESRVKVLFKIPFKKGVLSFQMNNIRVPYIE